MTDLGTVAAGSTPEYTTTVTDTGTGDPILLADMTALTLTLYDVATMTTVNGRSAQNVLNANDCTFHATSGLLTWVADAADTAIQTAGNRRERRRALFTFSWERDAIPRVDVHTVEFWTQNDAAA